MKILVIGQGGREHALCRALQENGRHQVWATPGNPGIFLDGVYLAACAPADHDAVVTFCKANHIDLVVVGPEDDLATGIADSLTAAHIAVFGPSQSWARLESSKSFAKEFMKTHGVATAQAVVCYSRGQVLQAALAKKGRCALKYDGLAAGKGVSICYDMDTVTQQYDLILSKIGVNPEPVFVVEDLLVGWEMSVIALCDGNDFCYFPPVADHKRLCDGDQGPNTGGMGVVTPVLRCTPDVWEAFVETIAAPTLRGLQAGIPGSQLPFRGALFFGVMVTEKGPQLLEYNCRFGDPETQVLCALIESGFADSLLLCSQGQLAAVPLVVSAGAAVGVVLATAQYPEKAAAPVSLTLPEPAHVPDGVQIFHSGTRVNQAGLQAAGGRVLTVTARGKNIEEARQKSYEVVHKMSHV